MTFIFESSSRSSVSFDHHPFPKAGCTPDRVRSRLSRDHALEYPDDDNKANHHADRRQPRPEAEPFLDDAACARAIAVEQESFSKEARAARDQRENDEQRKIVAGKAGRNRHDLIRDRREPFEQDDQASVLRVSRAKRFDLVAIAVEMNEPGADGVVERGADEIAE